MGKDQIHLKVRDGAKFRIKYMVLAWAIREKKEIPTSYIEDFLLSIDVYDEYSEESDRLGHAMEATLKSIQELPDAHHYLFHIRREKPETLTVYRESEDGKTEPFVTHNIFQQDSFDLESLLLSVCFKAMGRPDFPSFILEKGAAAMSFVEAIRDYFDEKNISNPYSDSKYKYSVIAGFLCFHLGLLENISPAKDEPTAKEVRDKINYFTNKILG